jgi:glycosyltransferase involved in cell wall biosynthesis
MSLDLSNLCEIRVPTFRRPKLLRRALLSILEQSYSHWRCIVRDDCPDESARSIVEEMQDSRIGYLQNPRRLGALGNIDKSFDREPMLGGKYAFVLEDDNYLLPNHIEHSIGILSTVDARVAFCNQYCEVAFVGDEMGTIAKEKTLDWMYEPGLHSPNELLPALLFSPGFSNGAAFWRTDCLSDFQIGRCTMQPEIQESLRLLKLRDRAYVSLKPTSVWRARELPKRSAKRNLAINRIWHLASNKFGRLSWEKEKLDYQSFVIKKLGVGGVLDFIAENSIQDFSTFRQDRVSTIERSMLLCGYNEILTNRGHADRHTWLLVGAIARYLIRSRIQLLIQGSSCVDT